MAQAPAQHQAVSPALSSCLRHSVQPAASQARSAGPPGMWQAPTGLILLENLRRVVSGSEVMSILLAQGSSSPWKGPS